MTHYTPVNESPRERPMAGSETATMFESSMMSAETSDAVSSIQNFEVAVKTVNVVEAQWDPRFGERVQRFVAGDADPMVMLICGYFRATYGSSIDLFAGLSTPIVERFEPANELGSKLQAALAEISGRQVGMQAMTTAILKQVLVTLVRRSLNRPAFGSNAFLS
jgi:hypothetical protein